MAGVLILVVVTQLSIYQINGKIENVALNKNTSATPSYGSWPARQAVDGDSDINGESRTCYHALSSPSFWTVDLGRDYQLYDIKVYLRSIPKYLYRTANSTIYLDNDQSRVCFTFPSTISNNPTSVTCNETARNVTIRNPGNGPGEDDSLTICEVVINGCSSGTHGMECLNMCNCEYCNRWSGICYTDCYAGWTGERCDIDCYNDTYGINCVKRCSDRECKNNSSSCDRITGSCDSSGCRPGWKDVDCHKQCDESNYGSGCSNMCSARKCFGNSSCDHVTGSCDNGCEAGWRSPDCTQACDSEHYGRGCSGMCTTRNCLGNSTCNATTGQCDEGCQTGWTGIDCKVCKSNTYGINCSKQCDDRKCANNLSSCDSKTGSCGSSGCRPGWRDSDCAEKCDDTTYGPNCLKQCAERRCTGSTSCDQVTGSCDHGCEGGWKGTDCREVDDGFPVAVIAGAAGGGVLFLVLILVLVIVLMRRRRLKSTTESTSFNPAKSKNGDLKKDQKIAHINAGFDENEKTPKLKRQAHRQPVEDAGDPDSRSFETLEEEEEEEDYDSPVHSAQQEPGPDLSERNYYNLDETRRGHVIPVSQLVARVREIEESPEIPEEEFKHLPDGFIHQYDESQRTGNKEKNRFKGYYPYNYNRVVLKDTTDNSKGDYINASYIDGYRSKKQYIAAQGPFKPDIIEDFWRMIWQEECRAVVMVTRLAEGRKMKCLPYWPEEGTSTYGDVTVTMEKQTPLADFTVTKLAVQHEKDSKKHHVTHFHFTSWPDHGVPDTSSLLTFMCRVQNTCGQQKHPIVVHCSAGIGRTGTYIAIESLVSQAAAEGTVDVVSFVSNMRSQRKNMVQTKEQYLFIYQAVASAVIEGDTSLDADVIRKADLDQMADFAMGKKTVQEHLEILENRLEEIQSAEDVTIVPSYTTALGFFVMTSHLDKEKVWNRIHTSDSRALITWEGDDESYLPSTDNSVSTPKLTATIQSSSDLSDEIKLQKIVIKKKDDESSAILHHYHVTGSVRDPSISMLIDSLLQWTRQDNCESTMIVSQSVSKVRLLILLVNLTSRLQDDGKVDVINNMRRLQSLLGGPHFTVEDVRLCLEFAQNRLESLGMYANL